MLGVVRARASPEERLAWAQAADWKRQFEAERELKNAAVHARDSGTKKLQLRVDELERKNHELRAQLSTAQHAKLGFPCTS